MNLSQQSQLLMFETSLRACKFRNKARKIRLGNQKWKIRFFCTADNFQFWFDFMLNEDHHQNCGVCFNIGFNYLSFMEIYCETYVHRVDLIHFTFILYVVDARPTDAIRLKLVNNLKWQNLYWRCLFQMNLRARLTDPIPWWRLLCAFAYVN